MKISIIMPVYNGAMFLRKSVERILNQPYKDIEVILVNDGSTDNSLEICNKFANRDSRIIVINKENGGICTARNAGLSIASGDFISFIDQDDDIRENIFVDLHRGFDDKVDMVISGKEMKLIDSTGKVVNSIKYTYEDENIDSERAIGDLALNVKQNSCMLHLWNCLYRTSVIKENNIKFNENFKFGHEDSLFNIEYSSKCRCVHTIEGVVYNYYRRVSTSTSLKQNNNYLYDFERYMMIVWDAYGNKSDEGNDIVYSYSIRLGLSLFKQYSIEGNRESDLTKIWSIIRNFSDKVKVSDKAVVKRKYYYYLLLFDFLMRNNAIKLALLISKMK